MSKFVRYVSALSVCLLVVVIAVYAFDDRTTPAAWRPYMYTSRTLNEREQGLDIRGEIPVITYAFGDAYERLNDEIIAAVDALIEGTRRIRARSINFDFEIHNTPEVVSVVIFATARAATDRTSVLSVNFNPWNGNLVTLTGAMSGRDITPLMESIIADMIRQNPATYYAAFTAPPTGQAFYITESLLVLLFDEFQLSSVPGASTQIKLNRDNINFFTISRSNYRISTGRYAVKMMPLRTVLEGLGYLPEDITWSSSANEATISRNGQVIIVLTPDVNNYQVTGVLQRSLEAAPEFRDNRLYVPISFFDQILSRKAYVIDGQGNITFMAYLR